MSLATHDDGGIWVADLIYIFDDELNLYWMSAPSVRHSQALMKNPHVAGSITISTKSKEPNLGIQFSGLTRKIDGPRHDLARMHYAKRGRGEPGEEEDVLGGNSWYMLTPGLIELIDEEHLGYEKKALKLT